MQNNTLQIFNEINLNSYILNISGMDITGYINFDKFTKTMEIIIHSNSVKNIDGIQSNVKKLNCSKNKIENLDNLCIGLEELDCSYNLINELNNLPHTLIYLNCSKNHLVNLDNLPHTLIYLNCSHTSIIKLNNLPWNIIELNCSYTDLEELDYLPNSVKILNVNFNKKLSNLQNLPNSIEKIILNNKLNINPLPKKLKEIYCPDNVMTMNKIIKFKYKKSKKNYKLIK